MYDEVVEVFYYSYEEKDDVHRYPGCGNLALSRRPILCHNRQRAPATFFG